MSRPEVRVVLSESHPSREELEKLRRVLAPRVCSSCKHWGAENSGIYTPQQAKRCNRMQEAGYVDTDGEPFSASSIGTAPDFGCVLFEAKETA